LSWQHSGHLLEIDLFGLPRGFVSVAIDRSRRHDG
jgi:hypothetical protein